MDGDLYRLKLCAKQAQADDLQQPGVDVGRHGLLSVKGIVFGFILDHSMIIVDTRCLMGNNCC